MIRLLATRLTAVPQLGVFSKAPHGTLAAAEADLCAERPAVLRAVDVAGLDAAASSCVRGARRPALLETTIGRNLQQTTEHHPDAPALISLHQGVRMDYSDLLAGVQRCAKALLSVGVERGDRVGVWAGNCAEWTLLQYASAMVGAILVSLNPAFKAAELRYALQRAGVSVLALGEEYRGSSLVETLRSIEQEVPELRTKVLIGATGQAAAPPAGWLSWEALQSEGAGAALGERLARREGALDPGDAASLQFTSGTTGQPKGACLSHRNILNNGRLVGAQLGYTAADRVCIPVPLFHCFGIVMGNLACTSHGAAMVYPAASFDPGATLRAVAQERCTSLYGVPTMFLAELQHPSFKEYDLRSLRTGIMAGSPCPVEVMRRVREDMHMEEVTICYGMTETSPVSFQTAGSDPLERRVSSVGRVHPHLEACVIDPGSGAVVPRGERGEVCVRGYSVMLGYWQDEAATKGAIDANGWMHTGDLGTIDAEGWAHISGRSKDTVIRGGENLFPAEVEGFMHQHPAVADVQVFGVPDAFFGEELCAWVRLRDGGGEGVTPTAEVLRAWCLARISRHKVPRYIMIRQEPFPCTASGKPQKFVMRRRAVQELALQEAGAVETV